MFPSHSESYFAAVAEASTDVMRILELDGTVEFMNVRGQALLEIDDFNVNHRKYWPDLWPEASRPDLLQALQLARAGEIGRFRGYCPTAKGRHRWWDSVVSPVKDEGGGVVRLLASSRDVTAEVRREERIRKAARRVRHANAEKARSLRYLNAAIDAMPAGLAFYDEADRLTVWNMAYEAASADPRDGKLEVGMTFRELLERDAALGLYPEALGREAAWVAECLAARSLSMPREQQLADGRWFRFEDRELLGGGVISTAVDITTLKDRETALADQAQHLDEARASAEAASEAKSVFLANMSHEIRTPLNGVLAMADLLSRAALPDAERAMAEVIKGSAETLEHLVSEILDLARIESGKIALQQAPFHLGDAITGAVTLALPKAEEKKLSISLNVDPAVDRVVLGDATRFRQILGNLLSNAVKFTSVGGIIVAADLLGQDQVRLSVTDTGIGFDPDQKARLFGRFEQADPGITRRYGGTGLGLAICAQLATAMGGGIDAEGRPGTGATFTVHLPFLPAEAASDEVAPSSILDSSIRVLVVDDHAVNRQVADLILQQVGAETLFAEDGEAAVEAVRAGGLDLVLMDIQMPRMDGLTAVREIRAWEMAHPEVARTPILMLSANALPQHVKEARRVGADGHVSKPITADRLLSNVQAVLRDGIIETGQTAKSAH